MRDLYSISGIFSKQLPRTLFPFGGFFMRTANSKIEGNLIDNFGISWINGELGNSEFKFNKVYYNIEDIISY